MKAQVLTSFDGPNGLVMREVASPRLTRPDEVKIKIEACGVCHRDITWCRGKFGTADLPRIMGHEGAGVVLEVGSDVHGLAPGDRVVHLQFPFCMQCDACRSGKPAACASIRWAIGEGFDGAYASEVVLPARIVTKIPYGIPFHEAAVVACTLGTAYHALLLNGFEPRGKTIALNGSGGGVGLQTIQVAKLLGARVIATTTSPEKEDSIRRAGADHVVVDPQGNYRKAVMDLTAAQGVDLFVEIVGAPVMRESMLSVRRGGRVVVLGNPEGGTFSFNPGTLIVRGELMMYGTMSVTLPELDEVLRLVAERKITPVIDRVVSLEELPAQMLRMESRGSVGRIVVCPDA
ncbi:MAG: alcohol dehydrogenase catalytic domain-containing protein [Luteimonas sp.]